MRGIVDRWKLSGMWSSAHLGIAHRARLVGLLGLVAFMVLVAPAGATGPTYPGETLTVTQSAPAVVGLETGFVATGQQADIDDDPLGFDFAAFVKDASVDPTCSPSFTEEEADAVSDPTEQWVTAPTLFQGTDPTFSLSFKVNFARAGSFLLCGYSEYLDDTAAAASVPLTVTGGTTPTPTPIPPKPKPIPKPTPKPTPKPANTKRPTITRSGGRLTCRSGAWSGAPTRYAYGWFVSGRAKTGAHARTLNISRGLRGHRLRCGVTASNATGATTARSNSYRVT
jgi:hypothetical protein